MLDELVSFLASKCYAVVPLKVLSRELHLAPGPLERLLAAAYQAGKVVVWENAPRGPSALLSAAEAAARGLELVSPCHRRPDRFTWTPRRLVQPERCKQKVESELERPGSSRRGFDGLADLAEEVKHPVDRLPYPTLFLGTTTPWPPWDPEDPCPICEGRKLGPVVCCLMCLRSGIDHRLPKFRQPKPRRNRPGKGLVGGKGRTVGSRATAPT